MVLLIGVAAKIDPLFRRSIAADLRDGISKKVARGVLAAAVLYFVFLSGNRISRKLFPFAASDIATVYDFKTGVAPMRSCSGKGTFSAS